MIEAFDKMQRKIDVMQDVAELQLAQKYTSIEILRINDLTLTLGQIIEEIPDCAQAGHAHIGRMSHRLAHRIAD